MINQDRIQNLTQKLETLTKLSACIPTINPDNDNGYNLTSSDIKNIESQLAVMDKMAITFEDLSKEIASASLQMKIMLNMIKLQRGDDYGD